MATDEDERRENPITIMVEPSLRVRAQAVAGQMDRSLSWVGKTALEEFIDKHERARKK